jgi:uncharacterized protein with ParB-like and HNH nuclease domain
MTKEKIEAKQICIDDLFGDKYLFEVPIYQRPFVWQQEDFERLFIDIKDEMEKNRLDKGNTFEEYEPYFLGSIVLHTTKYRDDESGTYDIIDGRQRLISLAIFVAVLRDLAASVGNEKAKKRMQKKLRQEEDEYSDTKESIRITVKPNEREFFKKYILTPEGTRKTKGLDDKNKKKLIQKMNESDKHMFNAIETFQKCFQNDDGYTDKDLLDNYIKFLLRKVVIVVVKTSSVTSAFRLFKTLNNRGIPLTSVDLLKSENLSAIVAEEERQDYAQKWEEIEEDVGSEQLEMLIKFIRIIKSPGRQQRDLFEDFQNRIFKDSKFKGRQFIDYLAEIKEIYKEKIEQGKIVLDGFDRLDNEIYYYNLICIMRNFLIFDEWMAAVICFSKKFNEDLYLFDFLKNLERRIVVDWISGASQEKRVSLVYQVIELINKAEKAKDVLNNSIFRVEEKRIAFENALDHINFYNRGGNRKIAKYSLLRIDMERTDNCNKRSSYAGKITVERILPENADTDNPYWIKMFNNEDERLECTDKIGNLTLLNGGINSKASNKPFPEKKKYYFEKRQSSFDVTNELRNYTDWSVEAFRERHKRLKEEAIEIWIESERSTTKLNPLGRKGFASDTRKKR